MRRFLITAVWLACAVLSAWAADSPDLARANQTLQLAGYPAIPAAAEKLQCQSWNGQSAGIYASFTLKEPALKDYLAAQPSGLKKASPIPPGLLAPPLAQASWFTPPTGPTAYVLYQGRIWHGSPELLRLYVDPETKALFLYYTWNNKRTYP